MPGKPDIALASMGIYVFETKFLIEALKRDAAEPGSNRDFGKDIIPELVKHGKAVAHHFSQSCVRSSNENEAYWRDVGTVDAYWEANIDLTAIVPSLDLFDQDWPIWTYGEITPPAKFVHDADGRRGVADLVAGVGRLRRLGRRHPQLAALHRRAGEFLHPCRSHRDPALCPTSDAARGCATASSIAGVQIPDGLVVGEDIATRRAAVPPHRPGHLPHHPAHDRPAERLGPSHVPHRPVAARDRFPCRPRRRGRRIDDQPADRGPVGRLRDPPLVKTGDMADVVGALPAGPAARRRLGQDAGARLRAK